MSYMTVRHAAACLDVPEWHLKVWAERLGCYDGILSTAQMEQIRMHYVPAGDIEQALHRASR
jgi:hypothetical protein